MKYRETPKKVDSEKYDTHAELVSALAKTLKKNDFRTYVNINKSSTLRYLQLQKTDTENYIATLYAPTYIQVIECSGEIISDTRTSLS